MRFHLIDCIDEYSASRTLRARKLTSYAEEFWEASPIDGSPLMPPALILEALCQAGGWSIMIGSECRKRGALVSIGSVDVLGTVRPGDVLEIESRVETIGGETAVMSGHVNVNGRTVLRANDVMAVIMDAEALEDPEETKRMLGLLYSRSDRDQARAGA